MGVRVIDDECDACCTNTSATTKSAFTGSKSTTTTANTTSNIQCEIHAAAANALPHFNMSCKDLVGNYKEFRIENNKNDLRIIGNGNRIRIYKNVGNLNIIGNTTRLKITNNSGNIKYTGNDGRIYLGSESKQQLVDYIGCNGILKVINSVELSGGRNGSRTQSSDNTPGQEQPNKPFKSLKVKSASFGGVGDCKSEHWQRFAELFQHYGRSTNETNGSLPNLVLRHCDCGCKFVNSPTEIKSCKVDNLNIKVSNNISIVHNMGNIVIENAVDVRI